MSIEVTVLDLETGDTDSAVVEDGDYILITAAPARLLSTAEGDQAGVHVLTVLRDVEGGS